MPRVTKKQQAAYDRFKKEVTTWLESVGAVRSDTPVGVLGLPYDYRLETTLGILHVSPNDDWVACRWDDVERALATIGPDNMNRHSGKWNHHYTLRTTRDAIQAAFSFAAGMSPYLKTEYYWVRIGDGGDYQSFENIDAVVELLNERHVGQVSEWIDAGPGVGIETPNYHGRDFVSLFVGDLAADLIRPLNTQERAAIETGLIETFI